MGYLGFSAPAAEAILCLFSFKSEKNQHFTLRRVSLPLKIWCLPSFYLCA